MNHFINFTTSNRNVFHFVTPILRPPSDCAFFALGPNAGFNMTLPCMSMESPAPLNIPTPTPCTRPPSGGTQ